MDPAAYLFEISTSALLDYLNAATGASHDLRTMEASGPSSIDWHLVLREGLQHHLHINLGIPGLEEPADPIEENPAALYAALAMGHETIQVILSGELDLAVEAGLISEATLAKARILIRVLG